MPINNNFGDGDDFHPSDYESLDLDSKSSMKSREKGVHFAEKLLSLCGFIMAFLVFWMLLGGVVVADGSNLAIHTIDKGLDSSGGQQITAVIGHKANKKIHHARHSLVILRNKGHAMEKR